MNNSHKAQNLHKKDLEIGNNALSKCVPNSPEFWIVKNKIHKYEVSWGQAINLAQTAFLSGKYGDLTEDELVEKYYLTATEPYRPEKKLPAGVANIDSEITEGDLKNIDH